MDATEQLLDEVGIDRTTGAAVIAIAGNRNSAAVNYHFGNLDSLIQAVLDRRASELNRARHERLDDLEAQGTTDPRAVLLAMAGPLTELLEQTEGRRYLRVLDQASNHPRFARVAHRELVSSVERGGALLAPIVAHLDPPRRQLRSRLVTGFVFRALAQQAGVIDTGEPELLEPAAFGEELADTALAVLTA